MDFSAELRKLNRLYRQMDETYHAYARRCGITDTALWLLYSLAESTGPTTQHEVCENWHYPPQTVNSALKTLERKGLIALEPDPGNRRAKLIALTEAGRALLQKAIVPLVAAENRALERMSDADRAALLRLTGLYADLLDEELARI